MTHRVLSLALLCLTLLAHSIQAGQATEPKKPKTSRVDKMDFGPFISATIAKIVGPDAGKAYATKDGIALKGIVVKIGADAAVCFDTDLMRYAAGWTGGYVDWSKTNTGQYKGDEPADGVGMLRFGLKPGPGVGIGGQFKDGRERGIGPLSYDYAKYKGLYVNGDKVIFSYSLHGTDVLDMPGALALAGNTAFTRTIRVGPSKETLNFALCEQAAGVLAAVSSEPKGVVALEKIGSQECVSVKAHDKDVVFMVGVCAGDGSAFSAAFDKVKNQPADLAALIKGGPARWAQTIETQIEMGSGAGAYVVDHFTLPENNPWNSWMRPGGFDFYSDGNRAALCTLSGDVWSVTGIGGKDSKLTWKRVAAGLYEPLGLKIVDDTIYVLGRDQITRLHDFNNDGEADFYENFCGKWNISPSYHAFSFELWTDKDGNFYFLNDANQVEINLPQHGVIFKISKDGSKIEEVAHGLRAPNGMAVGPNGEIVCSDNEGYWMPASKINWVKPGMFLGFPGDPRKVIKTDPAHQYKIPATFDQPMCWIPHNGKFDTSSGGEAFITSDKWGPFSGQMVHTSYGTCGLFYAMAENVDGQMQGGTWRFPLAFQSGIMRARFNPVDGQLYLCGLKGWQTNGAKDGEFCRVRYTGKPVNMPYSVKTHPHGIDITFTCALDEKSARDAGNYAIEQWNYLYSAAYGSKEYKASNPKEVGHDAVPVQYINISADKKTVSLALPDVKPVMQMGITLNVKAADGTPIKAELDYTINKVGK
ncbi:MAG TPA: DUF6797 domain-containing protein [Planctomycetota bacterium]|nr:DUF6797 domain-containing protein [Planctomycetota bacterium]